MKQIIIILLLATISTIARAEVVKIDNEQLIALIEKQVPIIDIRREEEWLQTGVVEGSILMTFFDKAGKADVSSWLQKLAPIASKEEPFILICRTGRRTGIVADFLDKEIGYTRVYDVANGITEWIKTGNPIVKP